MLVVVLPGERSAGHGAAPLRARTRTRPTLDRKHGHTSTRAGAHELEMTISPWAVLKVSGHWSAREHRQGPRQQSLGPATAH